MQISRRFWTGLGEFEDQTKGLILNLENDSVGIAVMGTDENIKEALFFIKNIKVCVL